jgi:hypothetical protein
MNGFTGYTVAIDQSSTTVMILRNVFITIVVLAPAIILFGMILFTGNPKDDKPEDTPPEK